MVYLNYTRCVFAFEELLSDVRYRRIKSGDA